MAVEKTLLTAEDLLRLPDDGMRYELVDGELRAMPPAGEEHGLIASQVLGLLRDWVQPRALGRLYAAETGFFLAHDPDRVRAPDVAFTRAERVPAGPPARRYSEVIPDLVAEVVSPFDAAAEVQQKAHQWIQAGVRLVWLVYPSTRSVLVYASLTAVRALTEADELDGEDVLPGFRCPVRDLFAY